MKAVELSLKNSAPSCSRRSLEADFSKESIVLVRLLMCARRTPVSASVGLEPQTRSRTDNKIAGPVSKTVIIVPFSNIDLVTKDVKNGSASEAEVEVQCNLRQLHLNDGSALQSAQANVHRTAGAVWTRGAAEKITPVGTSPSCEIQRYRPQALFEAERAERRQRGCLGSSDPKI